MAAPRLFVCIVHLEPRPTRTHELESRATPPTRVRAPHTDGAHDENPIRKKQFTLNAILVRTSHCFSVLKSCCGFFFLHPHKTERDAPQRMVRDADSCWMVPGSPWSLVPKSEQWHWRQLHGKSGGQWHARVHIRSRFQFNVDGSVARGGRIWRKPRLQLVTESSVWRALWAALGGSESAEAWSLNIALKEARRAAQGRPSGCTSGRNVKVSSSVPKTNSIRWRRNEWWSSRPFDVALARLSRLREEVAKKTGSSSDCGEPRTDSARCDSGRRSICRDSQLRARLAEVELERDVLVKKRGPFSLRRIRASEFWGSIKGWKDDQL